MVRRLIISAVLFAAALVPAWGQPWSEIPVVTTPDGSQELVLRSSDGSSLRRISVANLVSGATSNPIDRASWDHTTRRLTLTHRDESSIQVTLDNLVLAAEMQTAIGAVTTRIDGLQDLQSVTVSTSTAYDNTLNSQATSRSPLVLVVSAAVSGNHGGSSYSYSQGDVLYFAPASTSPEPLFNLGSGSGGSGTIADGSITQAKLAKPSVGTAELRNLAVTGAKMANETITEAQLAENAVTGRRIAANTIGGGNIGSNTVQARSLVQASIGARELADNGVTESKLASAVRAKLVTDDVVKSEKFVYGRLVGQNGPDRVPPRVQGPAPFVVLPDNGLPGITGADDLDGDYVAVFDDTAFGLTTAQRGSADTLNINIADADGSLLSSLRVHTQSYSYVGDRRAIAFNISVSEETATRAQLRNGQYRFVLSALDGSNRLGQVLIDDLPVSSEFTVPSGGGGQRSFGSGSGQIAAWAEGDSTAAVPDNKHGRRFDDVAAAAGTNAQQWKPTNNSIDGAVAIVPTAGVATLRTGALPAGLTWSGQTTHFGRAVILFRLGRSQLASRWRFEFSVAGQGDITNFVAGTAPWTQVLQDTNYNYYTALGTAGNPATVAATGVENHLSQVTIAQRATDFHSIYGGQFEGMQQVVRGFDATSPADRNLVVSEAGIRLEIEDAVRRANAYTDANAGGGGGGGGAAFSRTVLFNGAFQPADGEAYGAVDFTHSSEWDDYDAIEVTYSIRRPALLTGYVGKEALERLNTTASAGSAWHTGGSQANPPAAFLVDQGGNGLAIGKTADKGQLLIAYAGGTRPGSNTLTIAGISYGGGGGHSRQVVLPWDQNTRAPGTDFVLPADFADYAHLHVVVLSNRVLKAGIIPTAALTADTSIFNALYGVGNFAFSTRTFAVPDESRVYYVVLE